MSKNSFEIIKTINKTNQITGLSWKYNLLFILQFVVMILEISYIFATGLILEGLTKLSNNSNFGNFVFLAIVFSGLNFTQTIFSQYLAKSEDILSELTYQKLYKNGIKQVIGYPINWHEMANAGSKAQILRDGSTAVPKLLVILPQIFILGLSVIITIFYLTFVNIWLLPVALASIFVSFGIVFFTQPILRNWRKQTTRIYENIQGKVFESLNNIHVLKSSGKFANILLPIFNKTDEVLALEKKIINLAFIKNLALGFIITLLGVFYILYGGYLIYTGIVGFAFVYAGYRYLMKLSGEVNRFARLTVELGLTMVKIERFYEIYDLNVSSSFRNLKTLANQTIEQVQIQDVSFGYADDQNLQLRNLNLTINKGQKIGLVGTTGSGKSTFAKLLSGLNEISSGKIIIKTDKQDLDFYDLSLESWHQHQFLVAQDPELFSASILENITLFDPNPNFEKLEKAISVSQLTIVIKELTNGLETLIGEKGYKLSGGQRQRIGIARAIYSGANIICFDESTSSLDSKTEQDFQNELEKNWQDQTLLFVAHRLSTLKNVDVIYVFENGQIIESGNFEQLVNRKDKFAQLWQLQQKSLEN